MSTAAAATVAAATATSTTTSTASLPATASTATTPTAARVKATKPRLSQSDASPASARLPSGRAALSAPSFIDSKPFLPEGRRVGAMGFERQKEKLKYPKSVFFIISNEFCERFSYYGMRTILVIYLTEILKYEEDSATVIYHVFSMLCYFFPLLGSIVADSWLGKFRTIFSLSIVYAVGNIVISIASVDEAINAPSRVLSMIGLLLIAFGTGGIKPCVSAFGGDQFVLPQQEKQMAQFFSLFYFAINSGSLVSTFLTPVLREEVECLNAESCYPLAFGVPAVLMVISIIIFVLGKPLYIIKKPQGNVVLRVCKTMGHAISRRCGYQGEKKDHWLDYADDKYAKNDIDDIKAALRVLFLYLPLPFFWALFDQQGSRWTFQAKRMTGELGGWSLKPDQMQVINPLLILIFIPMFESCIYPLLKKCNLLTRQLPRLGAGGVLAAVAFGISAIVEWQLEPTYAVLPSAGVGQLRIFNGYNNTLTDVSIGNINEQKIGNLEMWVEQKWTVENSQNVRMTYKIGNEEIVQSLKVTENLATTYVLSESGVTTYGDDVDKSNEANTARLRVIVAEWDGSVVNIGGRNVSMSKGYSDLQNFTPKTHSVVLFNNNFENGMLEMDSVTLKVGGVYSLLIRKYAESNYEHKLHEVTPPNSVHMLWLFPQYIVMTMGEVMFSVTGLEFSYSQAPLTMKSLMQAGWLLTVAFGNLIVVIIAEAKIFERQLFEFILFAGLMLVDMVIFALMAMGYKYVDTPHEGQEDMALEKTKEKSGVDNRNFKSDDE